MASLHLTVCLFLEEPDQCLVALNEIAAGRVFGSHQSLRLVLCGQDQEALDDLVLSTHESCYPLVQDIWTVSSSPLVSCDVAVVLLSNDTSDLTHPSNSKVFTRQVASPQDVNSLSTFVHNTSTLLHNVFNDDTKVLVIGPRSNIVASLLSQLIGSVGGNQMLSFQPNRNHSRGQYSTAQTLRGTIASWWTGTMVDSMSKQLEAGIKFYGKSALPPVFGGGMFFSAPVSVTGEKTFQVIPSFQVNSDDMRKVIDEAVPAFDAMKELHREESEKNSSYVVSSHL